MTSERSNGKPVKSGPGSTVKLLAVFLLTIFFVFVVGWIYDLLSEGIASQEIEATQAAGKPVLVIDPNIEKELAKVLENEFEPLDSALRDPFSDRSNLSDVTAARFASLPTRDQLAAGQTSGAGKTGAGGQGAGQGVAAGEKDEPKIDIARETAAGIERRWAAIRAGLDPGPESAVFFIDDLLPVGMVSGGNAPPEVLMYSITMKRTYSFRAGAAFRDGWLATWRSDGVAFGDALRGGRIFMKPWATNLGERGSSKQVTVESADSGGTTD